MLAELRVAIKRENNIRDAAFLDLTTSICGIEVRQMTPRDLLILTGIGNPIVSYGLPSPPQLAEFLWFLSPKFKLNASFRRYFFIRKCAKIDFVAAIAACRNYIDATFQDSPASSTQSSGPYASWCAHIVFNIASETGWSDENIMNMPLKRLFQYLKIIRRHDNPRAPVHNPSDKVKGDYIRNLALNSERQKLLQLLKRRILN